MTTELKNATQEFESWIEQIGGYPNGGINDTIKEYQSYIWRLFTTDRAIQDSLYIDLKRYVYEAAENYFYK